MKEIYSTFFLIKNIKRIFLKTISFLVSTLLGFGYFPFLSGTVGSFISLPFIFLVAFYYGSLGIIVATLIVFFLGLKTTTKVLQYSKHDPSFVVIDEMAGQFITFLFLGDILKQIPLASSFSWYLYGFLLFRLFDIIKPQPAKFFDKKIRNAFGVMFDDIIAGLYASIVLSLLFKIF
jgi:phosphatidylglycerophosphatase A